MVLAIIAASLALVMFIMSVFGAMIGRPYRIKYRYERHVSYWSVRVHNTTASLCYQHIFFSTAEVPSWSDCAYVAEI